MSILRRKSKWQRIVDKATSNVSAKPAVKIGAVGLSGVAAAVAASAAVSSLRRRGES